VGRGRWRESSSSCTRARTQSGGRPSCRTGNPEKGAGDKLGERKNGSGILHTSIFDVDDDLVEVLGMGTRRSTGS